MKDLKPSKNSNITLTETEKQIARERFESHFGEINLGYSTGIDNERIDADIAKEYIKKYVD